MSALVMDPRTRPVRPVASRPAAPRQAAPRRVTTRQAATRPAAPGLRLNRRGRLVAWTLFAAVVFGGLGLGRAVADDPPAPIEVRSYTVAAGDTLWDISAGVTAPGQDVRDVVAQVRDLNGLAGSVIVVGDRLLLPTP